MTVQSIDDARRQQRSVAGRVPPHSLPAEESLLGAMLLAPHAIDATADITAPDDFYKPAHGHIYAAILTLHSNGQPADPTTVAEHLKTAGLLDFVGGPGVFSTLQASAPSTSGAASYARIVHNQALLRRLIGIAGEIAEIGYGQPDDIPAAIDQAEQLIWALGDHTLNAGGSIHLDDLILEHLETLERRAAGTEPAGLKTGLVDLDTITGGFERGGVITVAGRPGSGKSQVGVAFALQMARTHPVLFWSLEMSRRQMADRILANASGLTTTSLRAGDWAPHQWDDIQHGVQRLAGLPVWMYHDTKANITGLRSRSRRMATKLGQAPIIILDYLQLLDGETKAENRQLEVTGIMRSFKRLCIDLDTVGIILAQVNRNLETRADKRPQLADLRESGSVEQDSSVVIFTYRGDMYGDKEWPRNTVELIVAKNRDGAGGTAHVGYQPATGRYWDLHQRKDF